MESRKFIRRIEGFTCDLCGQVVEGDGYTNHCPRCLWSKHVDVHPGDRAASCLGAMKPVLVVQHSGKWILTHECQRCGFKRNQKVHPQDDFGSVIAVAKLHDERG